MNLPLAAPYAHSDATGGLDDTLEPEAHFQRKDYRWSGYGEAMAGGVEAQAGLRRLARLDPASPLRVAREPKDRAVD